MPIDNKLISGLVQQLKYMPDVVEALVGHKFRDKEVTEAQLDALLKDFLNEEHDAIQTVKISERTKRQQVRTDRQKECDTNKANKVQPFDLKVYNKNLLAAAANVTGIAAKIAYAKRPEVVAATTEALTEAHQDLIAAAFGKNQAERVEFTQNFEALRALQQGQPTLHHLNEPILDGLTLLLLTLLLMGKIWCIKA